MADKSNGTEPLAGRAPVRFVLLDAEGRYRLETEEALANGIMLSREDYETLHSVAGDAIRVCADLVADADRRPRVYSVIDSMLIHRARDCVRRAMGDSAEDRPNAKEPGWASD